MPVLELYNEKREKLPERTIPSGKIILRLQKSQACSEDIKYEVLEVNLLVVRGYIPIESKVVGGNTIDLSEIESKFHPGDRLYIELPKVKYTTDKEKTGEFFYSYNWIFKQRQD